MWWLTFGCGTFLSVVSYFLSKLDWLIITVASNLFACSTRNNRMPGSMFDQQELCRGPAVLSTLHEGEVHFLSTDNHRLPLQFFYCVNFEHFVFPHNT